MSISFRINITRIKRVLYFYSVTQSQTIMYNIWILIYNNYLKFIMMNNL